MQYQITQQVSARQWEQDQASVIADMQRRAQHDLEAQNPGSSVTIDAVRHTVRTSHAEASSAPSADTCLVDFAFEYTVGGQTNTFAA